MSRKTFGPDDPTPSWAKRLEKSLGVRKSSTKAGAWLKVSVVILIIALLALFAVVIADTLM